MPVAGVETFYALCGIWLWGGFGNKNMGMWAGKN
jgi:hypothetical protein